MKAKITVSNGCGDEASRTFTIKPGRTAKSYSGLAVRAAKRVLPDEGPWTVVEVEALPADSSK